MAKYYRRGQDETPFLLPGTPYGIAKQAETYNQPDHRYFVVFCSVCHTGLCRLLEIGGAPGRAQNVIAIDPCPTCLKAAREGKTPEVLPWPNKVKDALE